MFSIVFNICFRMTQNNSQIGNTPSEPLFANNDNESNIDQLLSVGIVTTNQPMVQFTTANTIPSQNPSILNFQQNATITTRQQARRRRRQRQRERRRERRQAARLQQEQRRQVQHEQIFERRQRRQQPYDQSQERRSRRENHDQDDTHRISTISITIQTHFKN